MLYFFYWMLYNGSEKEGGIFLSKRVGALLTALLACGLMLALCLSIGVSIGAYPYPSYLLQAQAWLRGEMKLDRNYEYLELAVYNGEYYVSFPPVPSVPMLLWTLIFQNQVPGGLFLKIYALLACLLVYSVLANGKRSENVHSAAWALALCFGGAMLPLTPAGAVWYEAQILAFLFSVAAIWALFRKKYTLACLCYALAVGCRPFSALLGPVLLALYWKTTCALPAKRRILQLAPGLCVGLCVAAAYGWYNYARFGNPFEFGHNYLPEFMRAEHGQLSLAYLGKNLKTFLIGSPVSRTENGLRWNAFGFSMFLSCPIFICNLIWLAQDIIRRRFSREKALVVLMAALNVLLLCMHRTVGGYQFGARYAVELLPLTLCYLLLSPDRRRMKAWEAVLLGLGVAFNFVGGSMIHL